MQRTNVVLPLPLAPRIAVSSPSPAPSDTESSARRPFAYALKKAGIDPDNGLQAIYAGSHTASFRAIKNKKVDAGELNSDRIAAATKSGEYAASAFPTLWKSDPIPQDPITVRGDLPPAFKKRVAAALARWIGVQTVDKAADLAAEAAALEALAPLQVPVLAEEGGWSTAAAPSRGRWICLDALDGSGNSVLDSRRGRFPLHWSRRVGASQVWCAILLRAAAGGPVVAGAPGSTAGRPRLVGLGWSPPAAGPMRCANYRPGSNESASLAALRSRSVTWPADLLAATVDWPQETCARRTWPQPLSFSARQEPAWSIPADRL
jgi:hypothetical protein